MLYCRYFGLLIPSSLYFYSNSLNNVTILSAWNALKPNDCFFLILSFIPLFIVSITQKVSFKSIKPSSSLYWIVGFALIICWGFITVSVFKHDRYQNPNITFSEIIDASFFDNDTPWEETYHRFHFSGYILRCLVNLRNAQQQLSANEVEDIHDYLSRNNTLSSNKLAERIRKIPKNIIFIVVESLPEKALKNDKLDYIAPCLYSLLSRPSVHYLKCKSLVGVGHSSDAQFMFNTGLLPLRNEPLAINYGDRDYPSLAKAFKGESVEVIGEKKPLWNHHLTTKSYGFKKLIDDIADFGVLNQDSLIFNEAKIQLNSLQQPFFMFITTLSMHPFFDEPSVTPNLIPSMLGCSSAEEIEFYQRLNHFDRQLEIFLGFLRENNLFDESLIIIAGDHPILDGLSSDVLQDDSIPVFIINSGLETPEKTEISQIDIFPTIMDIMNLKYHYHRIEYSGIGTSVYKETHTDLTEEDFRMSTLIIRGNAFH